MVKLTEWPNLSPQALKCQKGRGGNGYLNFFPKDLCGELLLNCEGRKGSLLRRSQEKLLPTKSFGMNMQGTL